MPLPFDLAHRLAEAVEDLRVDVHVVERHLAHVVEPGHHHARHPERDDVAARHQHAGRVVVRQLRRLLRPAERRVRPQRGAEPGVEHVGVLRRSRVLRAPAHRRPGRPRAAAHERSCRSFCLRRSRSRRTSSRVRRTSRLADSGSRRHACVPDRNPVAPPQLPADAPVAFLAEPVEVGLA